MAERSTRGNVVKWRKRRLLRRLYSLARLAVAGIVTWLIWWLWAGPYWRWDGQMTVTGNRLVGRQEIFSRLHVPKGTPLYMLDPRSVVAEVGSLPAVAKVAVRRWLFPARLEVMILERQALVRIDGGKVETVSRWIDQEGVVFAAPLAYMTPKFPIKIVSDLRPGDKLPEGIQTHLFELLSAWPHKQSGRLDLRHPHDVYASIGGWPVRFGEVAEVQLKFAVFEHVVPEASKFKDRLKYINLRFPTSPTLVLKTGAEIKAAKPKLMQATPTPNAELTPLPSPQAAPPQARPLPKPTASP